MYKRVFFTINKCTHTTCVYRLEHPRLQTHVGIELSPVAVRSRGQALSQLAKPAAPARQRAALAITPQMAARYSPLFQIKAVIMYTIRAVIMFNIRAVILFLIRAVIMFTLKAVSVTIDQGSHDRQPIPAWNSKPKMCSMKKCSTELFLSVLEIHNYL